METISERSFTGVTIHVDGKYFHRCAFERCTLVFHGREMFNTSECRLGDGVTFELADTANIVIAQLRLFLSYGGAFKAIAEYFLYDPEGHANRGPLH
ncbi:MAG TPA: hypothetical protein VK437_14030 [Steroidobacteraceae bacterium]|nr:hypothetical protein [Steroidobacteraceae bacterium]